MPNNNLFLFLFQFYHRHEGTIQNTYYPFKHLFVRTNLLSINVRKHNCSFDLNRFLNEVDLVSISFPVL